MASWKDAVRIALKFPGVEQAISYGEPSLKVRKSLLTRWRKNDDSIVLLDVDMFERDQLVAGEPGTYFLEEHYSGHDIVLANLPALELVALEMFLERRWRNIAPKKLVK